MFTESDKDMLSFIYNQVMTMCKDNNNSVMILIKLMEKKKWTPYLIDRFKGPFGLRGLSYSQANHANVNFLVIHHTEGMYGALQELMKRQKSLMKKNYCIICQEFLHLNVIHQINCQEGTQTDQFF